MTTQSPQVEGRDDTLALSGLVALLEHGHTLSHVVQLFPHVSTQSSACGSLAAKPRTFAVWSFPEKVHQSVFISEVDRI